MYMYVCIYVCMYVCMYDVCIYVCMCVRLSCSNTCVLRCKGQHIASIGLAHLTAGSFLREMYLILLCIGYMYFRLAIHV